ncbi:MAG TPA: hypothetical protein VHA78_02955 [Candidatus Peribacteraceae bacterium]|nr:hypothetical protein [Candidatus Peribacteraceae bacterium]
MRLSPSYQRHSIFRDISQELPFLALAGAVLFLTTLAVYLYAATQ